MTQGGWGGAGLYRNYYLRNEGYSKKKKKKKGGRKRMERCKGAQNRKCNFLWDEQIRPF